MEGDRILMTVLLVAGHKEWVAQCLEYDLAAQGPSIEEACRSFERVLMGQLMLDGMKMRRPLDGIGQAPAGWRDLLRQAKPVNGPCQLGRPPFKPSAMFEFKTYAVAEAAGEQTRRRA